MISLPPHLLACYGSMRLIKRRLEAVAEGRGIAPDDTPATDVENDARCQIATGMRAWQMRE